MCRRLQGVVIERRDALEVIRAQDSPDTLFFIDPPYLPSTRSKAGYRYEMSQAQHVQLLERLLAIQGKAVVAGYPSQLYDDMLSGWQRVERPHRAAGSRRPRMEVLWIKPACQIVSTPPGKCLASGARRASMGPSSTPTQGEQP